MLCTILFSIRQFVFFFILFLYENKCHYHTTVDNVSIKSTLSKYYMYKKEKTNYL